MDSVHNPYSPGAGTPPAALVGRDKVINDALVTVERLKIGKPDRGMILVGLRGVGKTVLLDKLRWEFERRGAHTIWMESPETQDFVEILIPQLRETLLKLKRSEHVKDLAITALKALSGFVKGVKIKLGDFEVSLDYPAEQGLADSGVFEHDLTSLLVAVGEAAQKAETAVVLMIDEIQYIDKTLLAALVSALHRCTQLQLPVVLFGAGLPQIRAVAGNVKSYTERMFRYPEIDKLSESDAAAALIIPAEQENVKLDPDAVELAVRHTQGYPYFLQEFGCQMWNVAAESPVTCQDAEQAVPLTTEQLDTSFFKVRVDRLTPLERQYLRAMAELGDGPYKSGAVAKLLGRDTQSLAPCRASLIVKGMAWSPAHGDVDFTVPLFGDFLRRHYEFLAGASDDASDLETQP